MMRHSVNDVHCTLVLLLPSVYFALPVSTGAALRRFYRLLAQGIFEHLERPHAVNSIRLADETKVSPIPSSNCFASMRLV
jgi:hypothetical protein